LCLHFVIPVILVLPLIIILKINYFINNLPLIVILKFVILKIFFVLTVIYFMKIKKCKHTDTVTPVFSLVTDNTNNVITIKNINKFNNNNNI